VKSEANDCGLSDRDLYQVLTLVSRLSSSNQNLPAESLGKHPLIPSILKRIRVATTEKDSESLVRLIRCLSTSEEDHQPLVEAQLKDGDYFVLGLTDVGRLRLSDLRHEESRFYRKRVSDELQSKQLLRCLKKLEDRYEMARLMLRPGPIQTGDLIEYLSHDEIPLFFNPIGKDSMVLYDEKKAFFTHKHNRNTTRLVVTCPRCNAPMCWGLSGGALLCNRCNFVGPSGRFEQLSRGRRMRLRCPNCGVVERLHHKGRLGITSSFLCSNPICGHSILNSEAALLNSYPSPGSQKSYLCKDFVYRFFAVPNEFENLLFKYRKNLGSQWALRYPRSDLVDWAILDNDGVLEIADAKRWNRPEHITTEVLEDFQAKSLSVLDEVRQKGIQGDDVRRLLVLLRLPSPDVCEVAKDMGIALKTSHSYLMGFVK
jgi:hypothetical protein